MNSPLLVKSAVPVRNPDLLADAAVRALVDEATLTPKPGLVDRRGRGSHTDMDVTTMLRSAHALRPTFVTLAIAARGRRLDASLRECAASIGRDGEQAMLTATAGVNTHRGAIWALGLVVVGAVHAPDHRPTTVLSRVATLAAHDDRNAPPLSTPGSRVRAVYGVPGAVGQARLGFPQALRALQAIRAARERGVSEADARIDGLLASMATLDDTCLLGRGGRDGLQAVQADATAVLIRGGVSSTAGRAALEELDRRLAASGLSPGGSADMLALALLLDELDHVQLGAIGVDELLAVPA